MKYVIDADLSDGNCAFCPCFNEPVDHVGICNATVIDGDESATDTNIVNGVLRDSGIDPWKMWCYDRPDWCPLVSYEEMVTSEWIDSVNSQPFPDEPKETIRVELYKSENEKLGALSIANGPSVAQMVAKLIDDCKVAKPYVSHGNHGPEPRFPGDAWTMWFCCGNCDQMIGPGDGYCKHCGAKLDWSDHA